MPKRRITAKQKAASRRNLVKARAFRHEQAKIAGIKAKVGFVDVGKPVPTGKTVLLLHRTSQKAASSILRQGFTANQHNTPYSNAADGQHVYGVLHKTINNWRGYGEAVVGVKVPRRLVKKDESMSTYYPQPIKVAIKDLKGRKVKQHIISRGKGKKAPGDWVPRKTKNSDITRFFS